MFRMNLVGLGTTAALATAVTVLAAGLATAAPTSNPTAPLLDNTGGAGGAIHGLSTLLNRLLSSLGP